MALVSTAIEYENDPSQKYWSSPTKERSARSPTLLWSGGYNDPMVVSDDFPDVDEALTSAYATAVYFSLFSHQREEIYRTQLPSASVCVVDQRNPDVKETYRRVLRNFRLARPFTDPVKSWSGMHTNWLNLVCSETADFSRMNSDVQFDRTINDYAALLGDVLSSNGFTAQEPYEDSLGGTVLDFLRLRDRLTYVFTKNDVQVLSYVADKVCDWLFEDPQHSKIEIAQLSEELAS